MRRSALPEMTRRNIDEIALSGNEGNAGENVRDLVRKDQRDQVVLRVRALVEEGLASGPGREDTAEDDQELLSIARGQLD